jgi:hypothetical protein
MKGLINSQPLVALVAALALVIAFVTTALVPTVIPDARAQQREPEPGTGFAIQTPPPVPGIDYSTAGVIETAPAPALEGIGTPVPPALPEDAAKVAGDPAEGGSMTASMGGSDIAVSSTGGSYERDSPRRGKRNDRQDRDRE